MSGYIEFNELWADMEAKTGMEISRQQAQAIFDELDVNGDGKVSLVEFKMKAANLEPTVQDVVDEMHNEAEATFDALDTDGSGYIEPEELWADLQKRGMPLTRDQVDQIFAGIDKNTDGKISLVEFKAQMVSHDLFFPPPTSPPCKSFFLGLPPNTFLTFPSPLP
jgi:Ca2+-binding EF-hand superfamily protein